MARRFAIPVILLPGLLLACGDPGTDPLVPTTLTVSPDSLNFGALAATDGLAATVRDQHGGVMKEAVVSWRSSEPGVAAVDQTGLVTAAGNGTATVRATSGSLADSVAVTVEQVPAEVRISHGDEPLVFETLGDTVRLSAEALDANGHAIAEVSVAWSVDDTSVAAVDGDGLVAARGNGTAAVSASAEGATGSRTVEVDQVPVIVEVVSPTDVLAVGDSVRMTARAFDAGGSPLEDADFAWTSSDTTVATANPEGWVRALAEGSVEITATLRGLSASVELVAVSPDRIALLALFESANGKSWNNSDNWATDAPLSEWYGVELDSLGRVRSVNLSANNLAGNIPSEIGGLAELIELHLEANLLEGALPPEIGRLENLRWLGLSGNRLTGSLPPETGDLADLLILDLSFNEFTGSLPPEVARLTRLQYLGLFSNGLTGAIPPEIGGLESLRFLDLAYNRLTGPIPPEIGDIRELESLLLYGNDSKPEEGNRLTGAIPPQIGNLANLRTLNLGANRLEGPIPPELGKLAELDSLSLYSNLLTSIPPELGELAGLRHLSLYGNRLAGSIPAEIGDLANLRALLLGRGYTSGNNMLTGSIPSELGKLARLEKLDLGGNDLTGSIPSELGKLARLEFLELGSNRLTGGIPAELGGLTRLTRLAACPNELSGPIPGELGELRELRRLFLCSNDLTGKLPPEMGGLTKLRLLRLEANRLTGKIPDTMLAVRDLLEFLWKENDGLCAPATEEFEEWLDGIPSSSDIYCESSSPDPERRETGAAGPGGCSVTAVAAPPAAGRRLRGSEAGAVVALGRLPGRAGAGAAGTFRMERTVRAC